MRSGRSRPHAPYLEVTVKPVFGQKKNAAVCGVVSFKRLRLFRVLHALLGSKVHDGADTVDGGERNLAHYGFKILRVFGLGELDDGDAVSAFELERLDGP